MKTTTRTLIGLIALLVCLQVTSASAAPLSFATEAVLGPLATTQTSPAKELSESEKRSRSDDLLRRARGAMSEGRLDVAERLAGQAEALGARYNPLNPLSDTPAKLRRELKRKQAAAAGKVTGPSRFFSMLPFGKKRAKASAADPFKSAASTTLQDSTPEVTPLPPVDDSAILPTAALAKAQPAVTQTAKTQLSAGGSPGFANVSGTMTPKATPTNAATTNATTAGRAKSDNLILNARRALALGDVKRASKLVDRAKIYRISYGPSDDTPFLVETAVKKYADLEAQKPARKGTESFRQSKVRLMMEQAGALLKWNDFDEAERLAHQAAAQGVSFSPVETNPQLLLQRIAKARRQARSPRAAPLASKAVAASTNVSPSFSRAANKSPTSPATRQEMNRLLHGARSALAAGNIQQADMLAKAAVNLQIPEAMFAPGEDRPGLVLLDIQRARNAAASGVVQASVNFAAAATGVAPHGHQAARAYYNPASDQTRNVPASYQPLLAQNGPTPVPPRPPATSAEANPGSANPQHPATQPPAQSLGMKLFQQGEAALSGGDGKKAMDFFKKASVYRQQLDPLTAQRLQDRLLLLSQPNAKTPTPPTRTLAEETTSKQQILARQVLNDVVRQENLAAKLRQSDPLGGLKILEESRASVEKAGLEPTARTALLAKVDRGIAEMKQFIDDNHARIELTDRNRAVLAAIDRDKKHELFVQDKLADMVEQYNQKMEEQSYAEAEIIAKRAVELAPDNLTARQLLLNAKFIRRFQNNRSLIAAKEAGFLDQLMSVDESSIGFDDRLPIRFPDGWSELTGRRGRLVEKYRPARSAREVEIEQKLKTPVSVRFDAAPLSLVLEQLAQLAQVNLFLDPQGLQEEGVSTDTPVSINLQSDISLRSALNLILDPLHLNYVVKDEVLKITSEQYRAGNLYTRPYNVADLVIPIPNFVPNSRMGMAGAYNDGISRVGFGGSSTFAGGTSPMGFLAANNAQGGNVPAGVLAQSGMPPGSGGMAGGGTMPMGFGPGGLGGGSQADFDSLIELITTTISPESWTEVGGEGSISPYENNLTLVVSQTQEVHEDIVDLLEQLRRLQDLQVTIEVRFITLNDNFFERIGVDFDFDIDDNIDRAYQVFGRVIEDGDGDEQNGALDPDRNVTDVDHDRSVVVGMSAPGIFSADLDIPFTQNSFGLAIPQFGGFDASAGASLGFAILSDIEAYFFINAAQGDKRTNVLQAPKVTLFNGQQATISDSSQKPFVMGLIPVVGDFAVAQQPVIVILSEGTSLTVQAVVSADRRFVRLTVIPFFSSIGQVDTFSFTGQTSSTSDTSTEGPQTTPDDSTRVNNVQSSNVVASTVQLPTYSFVTVTTTVSVPDGGTVLLGGIKRLSEGRNEFGTPMLDKIPYISRLFRNVAIGRETQSLMMMVTPRIIIQEEEEERIGVVPSSP